MWFLRRGPVPVLQAYIRVGVDMLGYMARLLYAGFKQLARFALAGLALPRSREQLAKLLFGIEVSASTPPGKFTYTPAQVSAE